MNDTSTIDIFRNDNFDNSIYTKENNSSTQLISENGEAIFSGCNMPPTSEIRDFYQKNIFQFFSDANIGDLLTAGDNVTFDIYKAKTSEELANSLNNGFSILLDSTYHGEMALSSINKKNQYGVHHAPIPSSALLLSTVLIGLIGFRWRTTMN
jgi:hypothetical protein